MKILLVLLDEDAASAPTRNRAELLYNDESTVPHNGTSILTLFRYVIWKLYGISSNLRYILCYIIYNTLLIIRGIYTYGRKRGSSWIIWKSKQKLKEDLTFHCSSYIYNAAFKSVVWILMFSFKCFVVKNIYLF